MNENNKCFCHFNGFEVKDAKARRKLEEIGVSINNLADDITTLDNKIESSKSLTRVVNEKSKMTDENLIYVLTTDNCWYYYDVESLSWVNGGNFLINLDECDITYKMFDDSIKAMITFNENINAVVSDSEETKNKYLVTNRYFHNGKFVNNTNRVVIISYVETDFDLSNLIIGSIGLQPGNEFVLEENKIYECMFTTSNVDDLTDLTEDEITDLQANLIFKSNLGISEIEDNSITLDKLSDDVVRLITKSEGLTYLLNDEWTRIDVEEVIVGGTFTNNSDIVIYQWQEDVNGEITVDEPTILQPNSKVKFTTTDRWKVSFTRENNEPFTSEFVPQMHDMIKYSLSDEEEFILPDKSVGLHNLTDDLINYINGNGTNNLVLGSDGIHAYFETPVTGEVTLINNSTFDLKFDAYVVEENMNMLTQNELPVGNTANFNCFYPCIIKIYLSNDGYFGYNAFENIKSNLILKNGSEVKEYELPIATQDTLGGVKIGENLTIDENGVLSAIAESGIKVLTGTSDNPIYIDQLGYGVFIVTGEHYSKTGSKTFGNNSDSFWVLTPNRCLLIQMAGSSGTNAHQMLRFNYSDLKSNPNYFSSSYYNASIQTYLGVINNLTSNSANTPLSANQGKVLNDKITVLQTQVNNLPTGESSVVLGENVSNSSSITLSKSFENYSEIDVYLKNDDETIKEKVTICNPKQSMLAYEKVITYLDLGIFYMVEYMINYTSTTSISVTGNTGKSIDNDAITTISGDSIPTLYIEKVVGRV